MHFLFAYIASLVSMTMLDAAWLGYVAPSFYKKHIGFLLADKPNWPAAVAFYLIFVLGVTMFVVYPAWTHAYGLLKIGLLGALFGLVTYATYDLTNQATIKNWPFTVTVVDILWGATLTSAVSLVAVILLRRVVS